MKSGNVHNAHGISEVGWSCRFDKRNRLAGKSVQIFFEIIQGLDKVGAIIFIILPKNY